MPPCNCGRSSTGAVIVFEWHGPDGVKTFATKTDAEIARTRGGGKGPIIKTTQTAPRA